MGFASRVRPFLEYRTLPTTTLLVAVYLAVVGTVLFTDQLASIPHKGSKKLKWLDMNVARRDLENIAARPHPYNSHANDAVRNYIRARLEDMADGRSFVHVDDDLRSNGSWASASYGVYFEGTNLLVKIDGTELDDAVLFSAHYDSVSTAPGATDDGMGVTTLLQLIEYFASNRMKRTAVFNINNGEEDWLNGAHAFMQHPWSNMTTTFVNLEGAAAGGRPMLFRSTSLQPLQAYYTAPRTARVRHPHGNVLSSDAFARGVIRSGTDYSVYAGIDKHGSDANARRVEMEGLDIAFYKGRSRYHTKWDSPSFTNGGAESLWAMIEVARGVGSGLLNQDRASLDSGPRPRAGVYFDFFKASMISFGLKSLLTINVVLLVAGPITILLLYVIAAVLGPNNAPPPVPPKQQVPHSSYSALPGSSALRPRPPARTFGSNEEDSPSFWRKWTAKSALIKIWKQSSFWIALVVTAILQCLLAWAYVALNPFTVYSRPYLVLVSSFCLAYLTIILTLKLAFPTSSTKHPTLAREQEKTTLLLHLHFLLWFVLLGSTILIARAKIGGVYVVTAWYIGVWSATVVGILQQLLSGATGSLSKGKKKARRRSRSPSTSSSSSSSESEVESSHRNASERTPLLASAGAGATNGSLRGREGKDDGEGGAIGWWFVQLALSVPLFVALASQIAMLLLDAMSQTLTDGSSAWTVYGAIGIISVVLVLPVAPFGPKLHNGLTYLALATFVVTTTYLLAAFPFTHDDPFKVMFQQRIELDPYIVFDSRVKGSIDAMDYPGQLPAAASASLPRITTTITASPVFVRHVLPYIPSARNKDWNCTDDLLRNGLTTCKWESGKGLTPSPGGKDPWGWRPDAQLTGSSNDADHSTRPSGSSSFFKADITRTGSTSAKISVHGRNTRNCRVYFDSPADSGVKVVRYSVDGGAEGMQSGYPVDQEHGLKELRLWSRTWDRTFHVQVDWEPDTVTTNLAQSGDYEEFGVQKEGTLSGRIACEWAEYESGMVDNGSGKKGVITGDMEGKRAKIPAFEEVLTFLPEWATVTKVADGLVEAWVPFIVA